MAENITSNAYEEARKKRLLENNKRFEELGIQQIAKTLSVLTKPEKKMFPKKLREENGQIELRRSKRTHNPNPVYDLDIRTLQEVQISTDKKRQLALKSALKFQSEMQSEYPSHAMSMSYANVCDKFSINLHGKYLKKYLPEGRMDMVLEDEDGNEYEVVKPKYGNLNNGWKSFAIDHELDFGDALLFELVDPQRFKIYIFKASDGISRKKLLKQKKMDGINFVMHTLSKFDTLEDDRSWKSVDI